jgi:ankyrin repeat protein
LNQSTYVTEQVDVVQCLTQPEGTRDAVAADRPRTNNHATALMLAAAKGHVAVLRALRARHLGSGVADVHAVNGEGRRGTGSWTALHFAANGGHVDAVQFLVQEDAKVVTSCHA